MKSIRFFIVFGLFVILIGCVGLFIVGVVIIVNIVIDLCSM